METPEERLQRLVDQMSKDCGSLWGVTAALGDALQVAINQCESRSAKVEIAKQLLALRDYPPTSDNVTKEFRTGYISGMSNVLGSLRTTSDGSKDGSKDG